MNLNELEHRHSRTGARMRMALLLSTTALTMLLSAGFAIPKITYVVTDGGIQTTTKGYGGQLDTALSLAGITLGERDWVATRETCEAVHADVIRAPDVTCETATEPIPHGVIRRENPALPRGAEVVVRPGEDGVRALTYQNRTLGGQTVRTLVDIRAALSPVDEIVEYGTKALSPLSVTADAIVDVSESGTGGVLTTVSGQELPYARALKVKATAYTTERQSWKRTATGTTARVGAIAVDPRVIPYGTRMYIQSTDGSIIYGVATAEDCGGAIKGNKIDLFFDTYGACIQFGVRNCTVYILA